MGFYGRAVRFFYKVLAYSGKSFVVFVYGGVGWLGTFWEKDNRGLFIR